MSGILQQLSSQKAWEEYLAYRLVKGRLNWHEFQQEDDYVEREDYLPRVADILAGGCLSIPRKRIINKMGTGKKRVVYTYTPAEMTMLKVLAHQLYEYDEIFAPNCHAFRPGKKPFDAVLQLNKSVKGRGLWACKLDISNYFNSISVPLLLEQLSEVLADDPELYAFFDRMLSDDRAESDGQVIHEPHGVMAGLPTASFLANVYLMEMDHYFHDHGIIYARYSDDIIFFAEDYETLMRYKAKVDEFIAERELEVNPSKSLVFSPDVPYEFLGFKCFGDVIDIADPAVDKMKGKIRRKMRAILRWKQRKGVPSDKAMACLIDAFNRKFFDDLDSRSLTWSRWYFPILTTVDGLKTIDHYLQQCIRVLSTGKHCKANYKVTYEHMKSLGYRSLVHEYYLSISRR